MKRPPLTKRGSIAKNFGKLTIMADSYKRHAKALTASAIKQREIDERKARGT